MEKFPDNPAANALPDAYTSDQLSAAISSSGFPLQILVADRLRKYFANVQPEWSYLDSDTGQRRNIDVLAETKSTTDPLADEDNETRCYGYGDLLVECKQSRSPYVFFLESHSPPRHFPAFAGLRADFVRVPSGDDESLVELRDYLDLRSLPFLFNQFPQSHILSRAVFNKKRVEIGGTDPYDTLVRPLMKAAEYFEVSRKPPDSWSYYHLHAVIPVAVLDAPMVGVWLMNNVTTLSMVPWVRVIRHSSRLFHNVTEDVLSAIDVVHISYLDTYIEKHVRPFLDAFQERVASNHTAISTTQDDPLAKNTWTFL